MQGLIKQKNDKDEKENTFRKYTNALFKVLVDYIQILNLSGELDFFWPSSVMF